MLKDPFVIRSAPLEMTDDLGKIVLLERSSATFTSNTHNAAGRTPKVLPVPMRHGIGIGLPQKRFGQARQFGQRLWIDLRRRYTARFHRGGVECQRILNFDPFIQEIGFEFPLDHHLPLFRCDRGRKPDQDNGEHEEEIGHTSFIMEAVSHG